MAQTFPSVVIQTYLTVTARRWGQFPTITFRNGGTAGAEVATVSADLSNISVTILSGTSTMAQVAAAINNTAGTGNNIQPGDLVSVVVTSGHNSDVVHTVVGSTLSGGVTSAVAATLTVGHLIYTAVTSGTAGNNVRIRYTSGGSLSVSVSTNDITVQLKNDGSSTNALIKAAVAASGPAAALVTTKSDGLALSFVPTTSAAPSLTNLAGGLAAAPAAVTRQGVTITSKTNNAAQNGITVTFTNTATAGAETVALDGSNNITVGIQSGTSTVTQIVTALQAYAPFTTLFTATGAASTTPLTVNAVPMSGAVGDDDLGYYQDSATQVLTASFVLSDFGFSSKTIIIRNEETSGAKNVVFSWAGVATDGIVAPGQAVTFDVPSGNCIWLKYGSAAPAYKLIVKG